MTEWRTFCLMRPYKFKHLAMRFTSSKCCRCWKNGDFRCFVRIFFGSPVRPAPVTHGAWKLPKFPGEGCHEEVVCNHGFSFVPSLGLFPCQTAPNFLLLTTYYLGWSSKKSTNLPVSTTLKQLPTLLLSLICSSSYSSTKDIRFDTRVAEGDDAK